MLTHWWKDFVAAVAAAAGVSVALGLIVQDVRTESPEERTWRILSDLPRTDVATERFARIADGVRSALYDEVPAFDWTLLVPPTLGPCPGAPSATLAASARVVTSGTWSGDPIPRARWSDAFADLRGVLRTDGFTAVDVMADGPDEQHISVDDDEGSRLEFTLHPTSTTFTLQTGCRLVPGARKPLF